MASEVPAVSPALGTWRRRPKLRPSRAIRAVGLAFLACLMLMSSPARGAGAPIAPEPDGLPSPPTRSNAGASGPATPNPPSVAEEARQPAGPLHPAGESASQSPPGASIPAAQEFAGPQPPDVGDRAGAERGNGPTTNVAEPAVPNGSPPAAAQQSAPQRPTEAPPAAAQHGPPSGPPPTPAQKSTPQHPTETPPAAAQHDPPTGPPPTGLQGPLTPPQAPRQDELQTPPPDPPSLADAPVRVESRQREELTVVAREPGDGPPNVPSGTAAVSPPDEPAPAQVTWDFGSGASHASGQSYGPVTARPVTASNHDRGAWPPAGVHPITSFAAGVYALARVGAQIGSPDEHAAPGPSANAITSGSSGALPATSGGSAGSAASAGSAGSAGGMVLGLLCVFLLIASGRYLKLLIAPETWRSTLLFALPERPG
jgi:hypothetical protein